MTAISRNLTKIWIVAADAHPSTLSANVWTTSNTSGYIAGQISNIDISGGDIDSETMPVFGGDIDKEKPRSQIEIKFTAVPALEASAYEWEKLSMSLDSTYGTAVYTTKNVALSDKAVFIQGYDGTNYKSWGFNNCNVTAHTQTHPSDDTATQEITMKLSPLTSQGFPNKQYSKQIASSLTAWSSLATS